MYLLLSRQQCSCQYQIAATVQVSRADDRSSEALTASLRALTNCQDARSQLQALSEVCKAVHTALHVPSGAGMQGSEARLLLLVEIFFQPYSAHLHRPLVATLRPLISSEPLRQAAAAAISHCISDQQQQWARRGARGAVACIPLAAAWTSITACAADIHISSRCCALQLLTEQIGSVLEQSQSVAAPMQAHLAHDLKVRTRLCCVGPDVPTGAGGAGVLQWSSLCTEGMHTV